MAQTYNDIAGGSVHRIAGLSDGVLAIAMTLIVLEIRIPPHADVHSEAQLAAVLVGLAPRFITYLMSFLTLGIFWVGQQTQLNQFTRADRNLTWLHLVFLASQTMLPFSTSLLAEFIGFRLALGVYWLNILAAGLLLYVSWTYAVRHDLIRPEAKGAIDAAVRRRVIIAQALYLIGAALCFFSTTWSIGFIVAVQLYFTIGPRLPFIRTPP